MYLYRKTNPVTMHTWTTRVAITQTSQSQVCLSRKSLMTSISLKTPTGQSTRKLLYLRKVVIALLLKRQQRQRLMSAIDQKTTTAANFNLCDYGCMNTKHTTSLPRIWKKEATILPFDFPKSMSTMSQIWNSCTACNTVSRKVISETKKSCTPKISCISRSTSKKAQPERLMRFTTFSIKYMHPIKFVVQLSKYIAVMTRGNQREIDRERARKRNAEKNGDNKKGDKSDFFKNKDSNAEIMRQKQKKFEGVSEEPEEKPEKKQKNYKKEEE